MRPCYSSKQMSSLDFGLYMFCRSEAKVPGLTQCTLLRLPGGGLACKFWDAFLNKEEVIEPKDNDISLLIYQYLASAPD